MYLLTGGEFLVGLLILGVTTAAGLLLKPKPASAIKDREPTTLATRGSYLPWIVGRGRTGAVVLWVGNRETRRESAGKGKGGVFSAPKSKIYYEAAWHGLAVGPGYALNQIWVDGKLVWNTQITQGSHPDGSTVNVPGEGDFTIYWGNPHPPVNNFLGDSHRVGIASGWPFAMYIVWDKKKLGVAPRWPVIDYDIEVRPYLTSLAGGSAYLGSTGGPLGADDGCNAAHVLEHLLTRPYPHGLGLPSSLIDIPSLQAFSILCTSEQLTASVISRDGDTADQILVKLLKDCGIMLPIVGGKLYVQPVRPPGSHLPVLTEDLLLPPLAEIEQLLAAADVSSMNFSFLDRAHDFRSNVVPITDDSKGVLLSSKKEQSTPIDIADNLALATKIADRRSQENLATTDSVKLASNHASRKLWPGLAIRAAHIPSVLRITTVKPQSMSDHVDIECLLDYYGVLGTSWTPPLGGHSGGGAPAVGDIGGLVVTPPPHSGSGTGTGTSSPMFSTGVVLRTRGSIEMLSADLYLSSDDSTYHLSDTDEISVPGGTLDGDWSYPTEQLVNIGPLVTLESFDLNLLEDLSAILLDWSIGRMSVYIDGEILFVQRFEALGGNSYRMRGVLRGRYATVAKTHGSGTRFWIFNPLNLSAFADPIIESTDPVYAKIQPYNWGGAISLASITSSLLERPVTIPFGPVNLRGERVRGIQNLINLSAGSWTLQWDYRSILYPKTGAGLQPAGAVVSDPSPPMGTFDLQLLTMGDVLKLEVLGITVASKTLVCATISAAFGGLVSGNTFKANVRENAFGKYSPWSSIVITVL